MSYNLILTHKKDWRLDELADKIPYDAFKKYVQTNRTITVLKDSSSKKQMSLQYALPKESGADYFYFSYSDGNVRTTSNHTDKFAFLMLLEIAEKFGVNIQGEEGETYTREDADTFSTYAEMEAKRLQDQQARTDKRTNQLRSLKLGLRIYKILLIVCVVSLIGILLLPYVFLRISQIRKQINKLNR